jgi:hypothetical protein
MRSDFNRTIAASTAGCSGDALGTVPVSGKVSFVGRERPKVCRLFFEPNEVSGAIRTSIATVEADGSYRVKAYQSSNGLVPGKYQVRVSYFDLKPGGNSAIESDWIEYKHDAGELVVESGSSGVEHNIEVPKRS